MEYEEEGHEENVTQMAIRLMKVLDYQQEMLSCKRRYVLERWPENFTKHKTLGFPSEGCVPERFIREEKGFSGIKWLVENGIAALYEHDSRNSCQASSLIVNRSLEPPLSRVQEMSDLEAIKHVPAILCSLNKSALKTLVYWLNGKQPTTNHRYILEREIKKEFSKLVIPSGEDALPEMFLKMASVVRSPSSYRHTLGSANPSINFIPTMPSCPLAAAHKAFACVRNFPTPIVAEVGKLLIVESNPPLSLRRKTHLRTVEAVNKEAEKVLNHLEEDDPLPACLEGALHVISLSARILFGNDGGLAGRLKPLPAEKLALERAFSAAYNQIDKLDDVHFLRVSDTQGKGVVWPPIRKQQRVDELQQFLIDSMHCIYAFDRFPRHVGKVIQMINNTPDNVEMEYNNGSIGTQETARMPRLSKEEKRRERINAELDAALNVSAAFQIVVWECYDSFYGHQLEMAGERVSLMARNYAELSTIEVDSIEAKTNHLVSTLIPDLDRPSAESSQHAVKIEMDILEDEGPYVAAADCMAPRRKRAQQDIEHYAQDVESFSDEAAAIVYVILGCLLKDTVMQHLFFIDQAKVGYLETGLDKLKHSNPLASNLSGGSIPSACSENQNTDELVLCIAKQLKAIPESVITEVEIRMGKRCR